MAVFSTDEFIKQFERLTVQDQGYVKSAIEVIEQNPVHVDYQRGYLTPHRLRQIHPITNKQLTVFFEILNTGDIYLRWVNDYKYPHNTWMSFGEDPCFKGLEKFLGSAEDLPFNPAVHGFVKQVDPKYGNVIFMSTTKLGVRILTNPYRVGGGRDFIANSVGVFDLDNADREMNMNYLNFKEFLLHIYDYFKNDYQGSFSFEFADGTIEPYILEGLTNAADPNFWQISYDEENEYTVFKMI